nr:uncharacterized protein LOC105480086 isoform X2 [Macaca nemestrina]
MMCHCLLASKVLDKKLTVNATAERRSCPRMERKKYITSSVCPQAFLGAYEDFLMAVILLHSFEFGRMAYTSEKYCCSGEYESSMLLLEGFKVLHIYLMETTVP